MKYTHLLRSIQQTPLAILPAKWAEIRSFLEAKAAGVMFTAEEIKAVTGGGRKTSAELQMFGSVAIIPVQGVLSQKINQTEDISAPGGTSTEVLTSQIRAALADPQVKSIVLDINSPGGSSFGIAELADEVAAAKTQKPVTAHINPMAASAAYWIASQASEIVITPSGTAGSIGVFMAHDDISAMQAQAGIKTTLISAGKYKTEGNMFEPLSADAIVNFQKQVDDIYASFVKAVASGLGVTQKSVREDMGQGRMLLAHEALKAGMVHRIGTLEETLNRMNATGAARGQKAAMHITTIREFEGFLRDAGFSKQAAKALAAGGFKALEGHQRDVETEEVHETETADTQAILAWLNEQRLLREIQNVHRGTHPN